MDIEVGKANVVLCEYVSGPVTLLLGYHTIGWLRERAENNSPAGYDWPNNLLAESSWCYVDTVTIGRDGVRRARGYVIHEGLRRE
jgi:hypothetical protein